MTDWQSIETAPRDGTWVLAYFNDPVIGEEFEAVVRYTLPNGTGGQYGDFVWETPDSRCGYYAERVFTHWMPLPPPPSLERAG